MNDKELLTEALKEIRGVCEDSDCEAVEQIEAIVDEVLGGDRNE